MSFQDTYANILNDLNRDVNKARPADVWQFCTNWFNSKLEEQRRESRTMTPPGSAGFAPSRPNTPGSSRDSASSASRPVARKKPSLPNLAAKGYQFGGPSSASHSTDTGYGGQQPNIDNILSPFSEQPPSGAANLFGGAKEKDHGFSNSFSMGKESQNTPRASSGVSHAANSDDEEEVDDPRDVPLSNNPASPSSGIPKGYNLGRRTSVSAESLDPSQTQPMPKTVIPKTPSQRQRIEQSIKNNLLFRNLDEDQYNDVLNAMKEVRVPAGTQVIVQGAVGDFFYVVESGTFEVWVKPPATHSYDPVTRQSTATSSGEAKMVAKIEAGGSFGELALMYNAPRAATVVGVAPSSTLWALDRVTFRSILMEHTSRKRKMYEVFLSEVGILVSLEPHERAKIADALEEKVYDEGEAVVIEGEVGKNFYIIESGQAEVTKRRGGRGEEERVSMLSRGDYFGELALLNSAPRAATVRAARGAGRLRVATLGIDAFNRLLGSCVDILQRRAEKQYGTTPRGSQVDVEAANQAASNQQGQQGSLRSMRSFGSSPSVTANA